MTMTKITYRLSDGTQAVLEVKNGHSVMEGAVRENLPGIDAECGGVCACATCLVHVDTVWIDRIPPKSEAEQSMLDFAIGVEENSRLSCQIKVGPEIEGLIVTLPESQR
jgi:2Fe-2S ferredoxin